MTTFRKTVVDSYIGIVASSKEIMINKLSSHEKTRRKLKCPLLGEKSQSEKAASCKRQDYRQ